jgi:tetratricopeptide (TPR) repeat protein
LNVEALTRAGAQDRNLARCRGLFNAGQACCFMGRYQEAAGYLEESLAIARELGENGRVAAALELLGIGALARADIATARGHLEEVLALTQRHGDKRELAAATNALAQLHRLEGALDTAEPLYETVLALARELADREIIAIALLNLAMVSICRGAGDRIPGMLREVHAIVEEIGSKALGVSLLEVSSGIAASRADWQRAALLFGAAEAQTVHTGFHRDPADEAFLAPMIANARDALGAEAFATAEAAGRAFTYEEAMAGARALLDTGS